MDHHSVSPVDVSLPSELVLHIISFAAPSTLAAVSQCSFDLLKYAAPRLYERITLSRAEQYGQLFCERDSYFSHRRLIPYLSLSQIKHLHFLIDHAHPTLMFPDRLPSPSTPLPLTTLEITYTARAPRGRHHDIFSQLLPATLIFSCAPHLQRSLTGNYLSNHVHALVDVGPHAMAAMVRAWGRTVRTVVLKQAMPVIVTRQGFQAFVFEHANADRDLSIDAVDGGEMVVVVDLTPTAGVEAVVAIETGEKEAGAPEQQLQQKVDWTRVFILGAMLSKFGSPAGGVGRKVVVRVEEEKDAEWLRRGIRVTQESGDVMSPVEVQVTGGRGASGTRTED